jgi:N-methylhydantoinase A
MPPTTPEQNGSHDKLRIGVDVGGTFTDLVAFDGINLRVVKVPSTPPDFHKAVIQAVRQAMQAAPGFLPPHIVHGSTVATNALLQRAGEPAAFVTTEGFRDMLLIGRQNRPSLYALQIVRPTPLTPPENWFTVRERISATGEVVEALEGAEIDRLVEAIKGRGLRHLAVCLLFSFVNPAHEKAIGEACRRAGLTVSLSSEILPEFREYERASTTLINASLRPTVEAYLKSLMGAEGFHKQEKAARGNPPSVSTPDAADPRAALPIAELRIMHSGGGTLSVDEAGVSAARLVLSGPAGGVMGAAFVARAAGFADVITYDMGGTSTDVAVILDGKPQWTTASQVDGLPLGLPAFDIITVGAGGGSIAMVDAGGALRVGPRSAGAVPGPACYRRGGTEPTVTDANLLLGRILPDRFAGGSMRVDPELARRAIEPLARTMGKSVEEAALGLVRVAEQNMSRAIRAVTSRRGLDPRDFTLVSFGGAGGLHACALAESLDIPRVLIPPYCGVLSALGMVAAPAVADASKTVVHLADQLDDNRLYAEFGSLNGLAGDVLPQEQTAAVEAYADVRFKGQSYEVKIRVTRPERELIESAFRDEYQKLYGQIPEGRPVEIVTLRIRRVGHMPRLALPEIAAGVGPEGTWATAHLLDATGTECDVPVLDRRALVGRSQAGPFLIIDPEATTYVMRGWAARGMSNGSIVLESLSE